MCLIAVGHLTFAGQRCRFAEILAAVERGGFSEPLWLPTALLGGSSWSRGLAQPGLSRGRARWPPHGARSHLSQRWKQERAWGGVCLFFSVDHRGGHNFKWLKELSIFKLATDRFCQVPEKAVSTPWQEHHFWDYAC